MPTYLGKEYTHTLTFPGAKYDENIVLSLTTVPEDVAKIKTTVEMGIKTMLALKARTLRSLALDTTLGNILVVITL